MPSNGILHNHENIALKRENSYMHKHDGNFDSNVRKSHIRIKLIPLTSKFWFHLHQSSKPA